MSLASFKKIEAILYTERLDAYRLDGADNITTLALYSMNMALSESLYPSLQLAEIALRNSIHSVLTQREGSKEWYDADLLCHCWQRKKVEEARKTLSEKGKPITSGRIVAELSLGFWTAFFDKKYVRNGIGHHLAAHAFPAAPKSKKSQKILAECWRKIRELRNRVFHHERIVHWRDLDQRHHDVLEVIAWIEPELGALARSMDRFEEIRRGGLEPWRKLICSQWI